MIVNCPECETSFNLPDAKVASKKGAKVRCSKCEHVFRVRRSDDGSPEIFYRNDGVADPPTQDLSGFIDDAMAEDSNATAFGVPGIAMEDLSDVDEDQARKTMMGFPSISEPEPKPSKSASADFNPFPLAGLTKKPMMKAPADSIDLFEGEDSDEDPFGEAFSEPEVDPAATTSGAPSSYEPTAIPAPFAAPAPVVAPAPVAPVPVVEPAPEPAFPGLQQTSHQAEEPGQEDALPDVFLGKGTSDFGRADELVDPSFGSDGEYFDPERGKVVESAPTPASRPVQAPRSAPAPAPAPAPAAKKRAPQKSVDDSFDDYAPHKIGGGGFQKFVNFLLILILVVGGLLAFVSYKTGWVLDFLQFEHMMEVALQNKEFQPRKEWQQAPPAPKVEVEEPLKVSDVFAQVMTVGTDAILVVRGKVKNHSGDSKSDIKLRIVVLDTTGKILREEPAVVGQVLAVDAIAGAKDSSELAALPREAAATLQGEQTGEFMAVITDVPKSVTENRDVAYRVEFVSR